MNAEKRREIFRRFHDDNPEPKTELAYSTPFELLIAVILSAQATDVGVNKATAKLFPVANTPEAIYALGYDGLCEYIRTIGLYPSKAKNVIETCRILIEQHGSQVPDNREALEALPGVGRKTANVPKEYLLDAHHWLILHGRYVCKARKPQCGSCRIEDLCEYKHKTSDD